MADELPNRSSADQDHLHWALVGFRTALTLPGLILLTTMVGFASLARDNGYTMAEAAFMNAIIWALPAQVVLISAVSSGASLFAAAVAVGLSSVRLMPMVMALVPEITGPRTRRWVLYGLSHFVAVTSWVITLEAARDIPRDMRTAFYAGLGMTLLVCNAAVVVVFYRTAHNFSPAVSACLLMLMPMYFLCSMWSSARERAGRLALGLGMVLGPDFHHIAPRFDLLAAGIVGGGIAFAFHRAASRPARA